MLSLQESVPVRDITEATLVKIRSLQGPHSAFKSWGHRALLIAPLVVVLITLLVFHPWGGVPRPSIVIAQTLEVGDAVRSYRMDLRGTLTIINSQVTIHDQSEGTVDVIVPDRFHVYMDSLDESTVLSPDNKFTHTETTESHEELIVIGDTQYRRISHEPQSGSSSILITSDGNYLTHETSLKLLAGLTDIRQLPDETVRGVDCYHYQGQLDQSQQPVPSSSKVQENIEIWIGKNDFLLRKIRQDRAETNRQGSSTSQYTMEFYDFNQTISIEAPLDSRGQLLLDWEIVYGE